MMDMRGPETGLAYVVDGLMFGFRLERDERRFVLVTDYPYTSPGSRREFAAFVFTEVDFFERTRGEDESLQRFHDEFLSGPRRYRSVRRVRQRDERGLRRVELCFDAAFGGVVLRYGGLKGFTRGSVAHRVGDTWVYQDAVTGRRFDFHRPFPELLGSRPSDTEGTPADPGDDA
jgi:hypothetical protein